MEKEILFYIQNGYVGNCVLWWGIDRKGYTTDYTQAGKYTRTEVDSIITRPQDVAWYCSYIDNNLKAIKTVVDGQYLDHQLKIKGATK